MKKLFFLVLVLLFISELSFAKTKQVLISATATTRATTGDTFSDISGSSTAVGTTENDFSVPMPTAGKISELEVKLSTAPVGAASYTFAGSIDGVNMPLSCPITGAATTCSDNVNSFHVNAGDIVNWTSTASGTPAASAHRISAKFTPDTNGETVILHSSGANALSNSAARYNSLYGSTAWGTTDPPAGRRTVFPVGGTIKSFYVKLSSSPGSGKSYAFVIKKDVASSSITCTVSNTASTCNDTAHTQTVVAGEAWYISSTPAGTPTARNFSSGIVFVANTLGDFLIPNVSSSILLDQTNAYNYVGYSSNAWNSTVTARNSYSNDFTLKGLSVYMDSTVGGEGRSRTAKVYQNSTGTELYCSMSGTSQSCTDAETLTISNTDLLAIGVLPVGNPNDSTIQMTLFGNISETPTSYTWTGNGDGTTWASNANWSPAIGYPSTNNDIAYINSSSDNISTPASILKIGSLELDGTYSGTLTLFNQLTIDDNGSGLGNINLTAGTLISNNFSISVDNTLGLHGGTLVINAGTLDIEDDFTMTSGTLTLTTGDMKLSKNLKIYGGTLNGGTSTTTLDDIYALSRKMRTQGNKLYNLSISPTNTSTYTLQDNLTLNGQLKITKGTLNTGTNNYALDIGTNFDITTGTLTANSSTINIEGDFTMSSGTVTFTSNTVNIGGSLLIHSGTFTNTSSTITLDDSDDDSLSIHSGGKTLDNLTINAEGSTYTATDAMDIDGTFTLTKGTFNGSNVSLIFDYFVTAGTFTSTSATLRLDGGGNIDVATGGAFNHNGGTVRTNFSATSTLTVTDELVRFNRFQIGNSSDAANLNLQSSTTTIEVDGSLLVSGGFLGQGEIQADNTIYFSTGSSSAAGNIIIDETGVDQSFTMPNNAHASRVTLNNASTTISASPGASIFFMSFVLQAGTFEASSGTTYIYSNYTHTTSTGTFSHNMGKVQFYSGTWNGTWDVNGREVFNDLNISKNTTGFSLTIGSGDVLEVDGSLLLSGGSVSGTNGARFEVEGTVAMASSNFSGGNTSIYLVGSKTQDIYFTAGTMTVGTVKVDKTVGTTAQLKTNFWTRGGGNFLVSSGNFDLNGHDLTIVDDFTIDSGGTLQLQGNESITGTPTLRNGSTVLYDGTGAAYTLKDYAYSNLRLNGGGAVFNLGANGNVDGDVVISAGTLDASAAHYTLNVGGDWTNEGSFVARDSTVTFDGQGGAQTIRACNGCEDGDFNVVVFSNTNADGTTFIGPLTTATFSDTAAGSKLTFNAGSTYTISSTLTLTGATGNLVTVKSGTVGTRFTFDVTGAAQNVSFVHVTDSQASTNNITADANSTNNGGNDDAEEAPHWIFSGAPAATRRMFITN